MPFIKDEKLEQAFTRTIGEDAFEYEYSFEEQFDAAFRLDNTIGSMMSQVSGLPDGKKATDFDIWAHLDDEEKLDEKFVENAIYVDNEMELNAVRKQRSREMKDREILADGGILATIAATAIDPINFIPVGGVAYKTYRTGGSILRNAMATATTAAATEAVVETELHRTQLTRTFGESAVNVSAATLFAGVLGATPAAISRMFSKADLDDIEKTFDPERALSEGGNPAMSDRSIGAAEVRNDSQVRGKFARIVAKSMAWDPLTRTITSDSSATRSLVNDLAENPLDMDAPLRSSVESAIKIHDGRYFEAIEGHNAAYKEYKQAGGTLKYREFNEEVGRAMRNGSSDPRIQKSADSWRSKLYDPMKKEAIDADLLPEDVDVATADSYLNRIWNKEKLAANADQFISVTKKWLDEQNLIKAKAKQRIIDLDNQLSKAVDDADISRIVADLEDAVGGFPSKLAREVKSMIKTRGPGESMTKALRRAIEKIKKSPYDDLDEMDTDMLAKEILGRIMSTPDGRLPYDYKIGENSAGVASGPEKGVFKSRSFLIPDSLVDDFLENDIELLGGRYLKQIAPDVELKKRFGDIEMKSQIKDIEQDYISRIEQAKTKKEKLKLNKQKESDIRDIAAMRDRLRGTYGQVDYDNLWVRFGRVARDLNYMRLLGGVVAASIPDVARVFAAEGIARTFSQGLVPLVSKTKAFKVAAREAKLYGIGTDALMGGRAEIIADIADYARGGTAFERAVRSAATKFSSVNLMNYWTGGIKQLHAVVTQTRLVDELTRGKYDKRLGQLGISKSDAMNIAEEMKKHAKKIDGVWVANSRNWDSQELAMMWGSALRKESDRVIIVPGQEKPLFMSTELGKTIFQFRTFMFSATQRVMLSTLQKQDKHYIQGILGLVSIGMMSYAFKQWDAGRELSDDPKAWVAEGIDRSGMLGVLMEINNTVEKISGNNYGLRPILNVSAPASRYASRSALDSALGPTFGLAGDLSKVVTATTDQGEWTESDTRAIRRLLPGQNLSFLRQGLDALEKEIGR